MTSPIPVWMDVDIAIGLPEADVDDGLALIQAFHSPEVRVRGISVVFGNTSLQSAVGRAREVVRGFGPEGLGVYPGAASADDFGLETEAVRAMAAALRREPLTILALGPVTNVATLVSLHPELVDRINEIVVVAGRRPGQQFRAGTSNSAHRDFNFELDPQGMELLLGSPVRMVLAPWEVSSQVEFTSQDLASLQGHGEQGRWISENCQSWIGLWRTKFGVDFFNPFDTLAVAWVTHPELIECMDAKVWIEEAPDDRETDSRGGMKPYLFVAVDHAGGKRVTYCSKPRTGLKSLILARLAGMPR
jgi:inosine-uridine nucleoside N-ribohydrolase